jgi:hypothetical protein
VTFSRTDSEWLPHIGDSDIYIFKYTIVEGEHKGKPEEKSYSQEQSVKVKISRSTQKSWGLMKPDPNLDKVIFQYALDLVARKVQDGTLKTDEDVVLFDDAPQKCPYNSEKIQFKFGVPLEIQVIRPLGFKLP